MTDLDQAQLRPETLALHAGQKPDPATNARAVPIYATTSYVFNDAAHAARLFGLQEFGNIYTRIMNPTTDVFEQRVAALEGGVAALGAGLRPGGRDARRSSTSPAPATTSSSARQSLYGGTYNLFHHTLPKIGITTTLRRRHRSVERSGAAIDERTKAVFLETIGNPRLDVHDLALDRRRRPRPRRAGHRRQHVRAAPRPADRARRRHRHPLGDEVDRRPRHGDRRRRRRRRHVRLGGERALQGRLRRPRSVVPRRSATRRLRHLAFILKLRVQGLRDIGAGAQPVQRVPVPAGPRDAAAAHHSATARTRSRSPSWLETQRPR